MDATPVLPAGRTPPEIVLDHTFGTDTHAPHTVEAVLYGLVEQAGRLLRDRGRSARRISVTIDHSDGRRRIRQAAVRPPTANDLVLFPFARHALRLAWTRRVRIRHLRMVCDRLVYPPAQQPLFADEHQAVVRQEKMIGVLDRIRDRFGTRAVQLGRTMPTDDMNGVV
jgi:DNA polymerase-4